jgi:ABC-type polysaccharide/polyol phosphate transport system ATPase subunit
LGENIIELNNVSMMFNRSKEQIDNLKEYIVKLFKRRLFFEEFWAMKHITFNIKKGESVAIVGLNGSGKSTLLKIIAQVMKPTEGEVRVFGSVAPLIELGAGFDMDLSARENIYLNGAVLGFSRSEMRKKFRSIIDFAELWDFLDVPIKNFSSGMIARLGFSIATSSSPDILIVDEILGVGDFKFQKKCENRIDEIIRNGATVIFVSHSLEQVCKLCQKAVWLKNGQMIMFGEVNEVCRQYQNT